MANFFTLSDKSTLNDESGEFDLGGGNSLIPADTTCLAMIDEINWTEFQGDEYINARWTVMEPEAYRNRKVFQKLKVNDPDAKKSDKAKKMLFAIDKNAGGKLAASGEYPSDLLMAKCLMSKPMLIKVQVWEMNDKSGNWIAAVSPRSKVKATPTLTPTPDREPGEDDDIAF